jgi:high-affinity nickel-transport protein
MLGAYGWAFIKPLRKLYYNMTITLVSVIIALAVGGIETLGLIGDQFKLGGPFWNAIGTLNDNFGTVGFFIIGLFGASWLIAAVIYRLKNYDQVQMALAES